MAEVSVEDLWKRYGTTRGTARIGGLDVVEEAKRVRELISFLPELPASRAP